MITWSTVADIINVLKLADSSSEDLSECEENYSQTDWGVVELEAIQKSRDQEPLHLQQQKKLADLAKKINDSPQGIVIMETEQSDKKENVDSTSPSGSGKKDETKAVENVDLTKENDDNSQQNDTDEPTDNEHPETKSPEAKSNLEDARTPEGKTNEQKEDNTGAKPDKSKHKQPADHEFAYMLKGKSVTWGEHRKKPREGTFVENGVLWTRAKETNKFIGLNPSDQSYWRMRLYATSENQVRGLIKTEKEFQSYPKDWVCKDLGPEWSYMSPTELKQYLKARNAAKEAEQAAKEKKAKKADKTGKEVKPKKSKKDKEPPKEKKTKKSKAAPPSGETEKPIQLKTKPIPKQPVTKTPKPPKPAAKRKIQAVTPPAAKKSKKEESEEESSAEDEDQQERSDDSSEEESETGGTIYDDIDDWADYLNRYPGLTTNESQGQQLAVELVGVFEKMADESKKDRKANMEQLAMLMKNNQNSHKDDTDEDSRDSKEEKRNKEKKINTYEVQIESQIDDMNSQLTPARYLAMGVNFNHYMYNVPDTIEPVRTNYNTNVFGLKINQHKAVIAAHDRTSTIIQLKWYLTENLSRVENKQAWVMTDNQMQNKSVDKELRALDSCEEALFNFHIISVQVYYQNNQSKYKKLTIIIYHRCAPATWKR